MPAMRVWPVSSSDETRKVGSSSARRCSPVPSLSWSPFVFGSIATEITGSGKVIDSSTIGEVSTASVSPVVVCFRPTPAAMSPAPISSRSSRWLACIWRMRPIRSVLPFVVLRTRSPALTAARVDAEVRQLADVWIRHDLEGQGGERRIGIGVARQLLLGLRVEALDRGDVERARQVVDHRVEQRLHALVLERRAEQHRGQRIGERARTKRALDHLRRDERLVGEVGLRELVVVLGDRVDQLMVILLRLFEQLGGDLADVHLRAEVVGVRDGLHLDEVDDAAVVLLLPDRELDRHGVAPRRSTMD